VSAVYFKGKWTNPFDPQLSRPADFHCQDGSIKNISMMTQTQEMDYFEDEDKQAVRLSYGKGHFSMLILLPRPTVPLENLTSNLTMQQWSVMDALMSQVKVKLILPRFKLEYKAELRPTLTSLGMPSAFSGQADFSAMAAVALKISNVIHKACLEVNEQGSEAAAATAVVMKRAIPVPEKQITMKVDRPFLVAILDNESKLPIFLGAVYDPENE
ncbi:MAG TPA: serpin family protein, partial [Longilinea sp.]|nr:serpin family protein [Longilinea sp.]